MKRLHIRLSAILAFVLLCGLLLFALNPALADVDDSYSVALLHMNGADTSTTFTDESGKAWTPLGNAQLDTAQSVFGAASVLLDGNGDYASAADSADWRLDDGSNSNLWTIDFWVRFNGDPGTATRGLLDQYLNDSNFWWLNLSNNQLCFGIRSGGTTLVQICQAWNPADATWYHIAIVKNGASGYMDFVNGAQIGSTTTDTDPMPDYSALMYFGMYYYGSTWSYHNGWIDELRISKGIARWTANFTPPDAEYPDRTIQTATAAYQQTSTAAALTATAANGATQTAALYQTQTAAAITATAANDATQTAISGNIQTQVGVIQTWVAGHDQTQIAALSATPTITLTPTLTGTPNPAAQFESTISYGDIARTNALACIATIGGLWALVWIVVTFFGKRRRT